MLQLFFAVAFSAVPLTLYLPPIRSLNLFVHTIEGVLRHTAVLTLRTYPRIRLALSRVIRSLFHLSRHKNLFWEYLAGGCRFIYNIVRDRIRHVIKGYKRSL